MRSKITNQEFDAEIGRVAAIADRARDLALLKAERVRRFLGAAALRETARLRAKDGADAPTVIAQATTALGQSRTITRLRDELKSLGLGRRVKRDTIVFGKIVATAGRPASGVRIRLATDDGRAIGAVVADDAGLFIVDVPRDKFDRLVEGAKALVVVVQDPAGRELAKTSVPVRKRGAVLVNIDVSAKRDGHQPVTPERDLTPTPEAKALTDIRGLGRARIARLNEAGIKSVADLAGAKSETLAALLRVSTGQADELIAQAKELLGA